MQSRLIVSWNECLNLWSRRWLKFSRNCVRYFIPLRLSHWKILFGAGLMILKMLSLKELKLVELPINFIPLNYVWRKEGILLRSCASYSLTLSWRRPLSYTNQSIALQSKSMDWFLYDNGLRFGRVKGIRLVFLVLYQYYSREQLWIVWRFVNYNFVKIKSFLNQRRCWRDSRPNSS